MDALLNWLWQGSVVAAAAFVTLFALRRAGAAVRCGVCWAAMLLIVGLPVLPALAPSPLLADATGSAQNVAMVSLPDAWWTSTMVIVVAWMAWTAVQLAKFVSAIGAIRRARARSRAFPSDVECNLPHWRRVRGEGRRATLVLSNSVTSAAVLGWGRPMIAVAPSLVRRLDPADLDRILIHEWAHVQRRDDVANVLQILVRTLAGWHPALWSLDRRLHVEREIACDEMTVRITGSPKSYAECLIKLAGLRAAPRAMQAAPAVFTPSSLRARVVKIVSPHPSLAPVWSRSLATAIVAVLCVVSFAVGGLTLVEAEALVDPLLPSRTLALDMSSDRRVPVASTTLSDTKTDRSVKRAAARSSIQRPKSDPPLPPQAQPTQPPPQPQPKPAAPVVVQEPRAVESTHSAGPDPAPAPAATPQAGDAPAQTPPAAPPPKATPEPPRSPWAAAAAGGVALGRKSKDAGVATGGFFTRFARRVAGSS